MSKDRLDCEDICPNYYSSWEEGTCMESCEIRNRGECPVVYVNDLEKQIADLEAKLAEKETRIAELEDKDWYELTIKQLEEQCERLIIERDNAELKLADKDKEIQQWKSMAERSSSMLDRFNYCGESVVYNTTREQDKISFAVEQLEHIKKRIDNLRYKENKCLNKKDCIEDCLEELNHQIEELKKEMK